MSLDLTTRNRIYYVLRISMAMCFLGHGIFGIITKKIWVNYFAVAGIGTHEAYSLMPVVGTVDIIMALVVIFFPVRAVAAWLVIWGFTTAAMRPLSGEPFAEMVERIANYGVPIAFLLLTGWPRNTRSWFARVLPSTQAGNEFPRALDVVLRCTVFCVLLGHGWLNVIEKKSLLAQYAAIGFSHPASVAHSVGVFEIAAAVLTLFRPAPAVLLILLVWKMATELFYPNYELFEWIERGGSYGAILSLCLASGCFRNGSKATGRRMPSTQPSSA